MGKDKRGIGGEISGSCRWLFIEKEMFSISTKIPPGWSRLFSFHKRMRRGGV